VERAHRELRARLADRLRGDDAHREAAFDETPGREIAAIALRAHTAAGRARQHGADLHALDAGRFDLFRQFLLQLAPRFDDGLAGGRVDDRLERDAADDAVAEALDDFTAGVDDRTRFEAVERAAIDLRDDHVLGDVDQTPREVARVGRLERRVRETLARA